MAKQLQARYERPDKRQALREQEKIQAEYTKLLKEIQEDFEQNGWIAAPQEYHEHWMRWCQDWNKKQVITLANPRIIHDYLISHNIPFDASPFLINEPFTI